MGSRSLWHCGLTLQESTKVVARLDVFLGALTATLVAVYLNNYQEKDKVINDETLRTDTEGYNGGWISTTFTPKHYIVMGAASVVQLVMGVTLFMGAMNKSRKVCWVWMATTLLGVFLVWNFLIRIYEMVIVGAFIHEMRNERVEINSRRELKRPSAKVQVRQLHVPPTIEDGYPKLEITTGWLNDP